MNTNLAVTKVTRIHQIEITSRCNLNCKYCAYPTMPRKKMDMQLSTFNAALDMVEHFVKKGAQTELNLAGIGESTIHPQFAEFITLARHRLPRIDLVIPTNGVNMTDDIAAVLAENRVRTWVSLHRPEKAGLAVHILRARGILAGVSTDSSTAAINWGGQVDWPVSAPAMDCMWQRDGRAIVWSDGRIGSCSMDGEGYDGAIGTVNDDPDWLFVKPYSLCSKCHQTIGAKHA
jgi:hypothetical protein